MNAREFGESARSITDAALPRGLVVTLFAYFDESENAQANIYCVAGYLFRSEALDSLEADWARILATYDAPHFHMVDCAHGDGVFKDWDKDKRIRLQTDLFAVLTKYALVGFATTFDTEAADAIAAQSLYGSDSVSPHTLCAWWCLKGAAEWARDNEPNEDVAYFFESGSSRQRSLNGVLETMFGEGGLAGKYRYVSHTFIRKESCGAIQCADIAAWQIYKGRKCINERRPFRKDLNVLLGAIDHQVSHFDKSAIQGAVRVLKRADRTIKEMRAAVFHVRAKFLRNGTLLIEYIKRPDGSIWTVRPRVT